MDGLKRIILIFTGLCAVTGLATYIAMRVFGLGATRLSSGLLPGSPFHEFATSVLPGLAPRPTSSTAPQPAAAASSGAVLAEVQGTVRVRRAGAFIPLLRNMELRAGDTLTTEGTSTAAIIYPDFGRTVVNGGSTVTITQGAEDASHQSLRMRLELEAGRIWTRLQRTLGVGSDFSVRAANVVATVRGTSFGVELQDGHVAVQVMESHVAVTKVTDRPASLGEIQQGVAVDGRVEVPVSLPAIAGPQEAVQAISDVPGAPQLAPMTEGEVDEDFVQAANSEIPEEALRLTPNAPPPPTPVIPPPPPPDRRTPYLHAPPPQPLLFTPPPTSPAPTSTPPFLLPRPLNAPITQVRPPTTTPPARAPLPAPQSATQARPPATTQTRPPAPTLTRPPTTTRPVPAPVPYIRPPSTTLFVPPPTFGTYPTNTGAYPPPPSTTETIRLPPSTTSSTEVLPPLPPGYAPNASSTYTPPSTTQQTQVIMPSPVITTDQAPPPTDYTRQYVPPTDTTNTTNVAR